MLQQCQIRLRLLITSTKICINFDDQDYVLENEHHHQNPQIQISIDTKFCIQQTTIYFQTKFAQIDHFRSKNKKVNITTKIYLFELMQVPNFSLNRQFQIFKTKFAQDLLVNHLCQFAGDYLSLGVDGTPLIQTVYYIKRIFCPNFSKIRYLGMEVLPQDRVVFY